jgi:WhiB family redox-sensing transcriptional regulator
MRTHTHRAVRVGAGPRPGFVPGAVDTGGIGWHERAACADPKFDPADWFPESGDRGAAAKRVCRHCPVRVACLASALGSGERFGIWGGTSETGRAALRRAARAVAS